MAEADFSRPTGGSGSVNGISEHDETLGASSQAGRDRGPAGIAPRDSSRRLILLVASFWAGLAGVISWAVGEAKLVEASAKHVQFVAAGRPIEWSTPATREAAAEVTSSRLHAAFGGLLGLVLGLVGGRSRRSMPGAVRAGLVGAVLGVVVGGGAPYWILPAYARYRQVSGGDLGASLVLHATLWSGIGAAGGLALGLGLGGWSRAWRAALGGLLGALGGGLLFDLLGAWAFPLEETGLPSSATARTRLLARLLVAVLAAAGAAWAAGQTASRVGTTERK
jgi:hypothetical protein